MVLSFMKWRIITALIVCTIAAMLVIAGCNKKDSDSLPSLTPEAKKGNTPQKRVQGRH